MTQSILGPDTIEWLGVSYRTILSADATGGAMSVVDSISPLGSGPPRHVHLCEDETFVLLDGSCEFWVDGATSIHGPGEAVFVPRGVEHTFRVVGDGPSHHLLILTPGGFEGFFSEMARGGWRIPDDMAQINEAAARFSLTLTGPPLAEP